MNRKTKLSGYDLEQDIIRRQYNALKRAETVLDQQKVMLRFHDEKVKLGLIDGTETRYWKKQRKIVEEGAKNENN